MRHARRQHFGQRVTRLMLLLGAWALVASHAAGDSITLKPSARLAGDHATLADVAELEGPYAESLAGIIVIDDVSGIGAEGGLRLTIEQLRNALDQADPSTPVRWGVLSMRGADVVIRRRVVVNVTPADEPVTTDNGDGSQVVDSLANNTVRWHLGQRMTQILGVPESEIRLRFEAADRELLETPTLGRVVEVSINAKGGSAPASVKVFEADRLIASGTAKVGVEVRREVVVATSVLSRGDLIGSSDVQAERRWIAPDLRFAAAEDVRGSEVRTRLEPGRMILLSDIESPVIVKRGDLVNVHVHSGTIALKTTARAKGSGREGDVVTFESLTDKKRTYRARMSGPGTAVALTPEEESRIPETEVAASPAQPVQVEPTQADQVKRLPKPTPDQSRAAVGGVIVERRANADGTESVKVQPPDASRRPRTLKFFPVDE